MTQISHDAGQQREPARTVLAGQTVCDRSPTLRASSSSRSQRAIWLTTTLTPSDLPRTVRGRPLTSAAVVTHLVTHLPRGACPSWLASYDRCVGIGTPSRSVLLVHAYQKTGIGRRWTGNAADVEPAGTWKGPDFITLHPTPQWLATLRQVGVDLLAYDGARASEVTGPFADAAQRIQDDPSVPHPLRPADWPPTGFDVIELLQEAAELCARRPAATFRVSIRDTHDSDPSS